MPRFLKVERAKAIIQDGVELTLKPCVKCKTEFCGTENQHKCETCRSKKKTKRLARMWGYDPLAYSDGYTRCAVVCRLQEEQF